MKERQYDVALSFAGEDRHYAATLTQLFSRQGGIQSFTTNTGKRNFGA